jgi:DNA invertase Pin-like site-specific DNA recombinase
MIIGYAKLPGSADPTTIDQTRQQLILAGAEQIFLDTDPRWPNAMQGATQAQPHGRDAALAACGAGDVLLALSSEHLASSVRDLIAVAERLTASGASLRVLRVPGLQGLDTGTPQGATMMGTLALLAAFQPAGGPSGMFGLPMHNAQAQNAQRQNGFADMLLSDQMALRRPRGRPPTATTQASEISRLRATGMRATDIAERLKICRASVYRVLNLTTPDAPRPFASPSVDRQLDRVNVRMAAE